MKKHKSAFQDTVLMEVHMDGSFTLAEELKYYSETVQELITVPVGQPTDFASIPWWARWLIPKIGKYNLAAVVHDYLYHNAVYTKSKADTIFREAMKVLGVGKVKRNVMYAAVTIGGKGNY